MTTTLRPAALLLATAATGLALAGCKVDNRPLLARGQPAPAAYATGLPAPGPLDPAYGPASYAQPPAYLSPQQAYAYPARAYRVSQAYYDEPPAYAFAYEDEQPWAWGAADEDVMFAEPYDDGYRYYYYEAGDDYPYFVQDGDYGYAYGDTGALIALFDAAGVLVSYDRYGDYGRRAHDDWSRGYALDQAWRGGRRYDVQPTVWRQRAPALASGRERWFQAAAAQPAWRETVARGDYALPRMHGGHGDRGRWNGAAPARVAEAAPAPVRGWRGPEHAAPMAPGRPQAFARAEGPHGRAFEHGHPHWNAAPAAQPQARAFAEVRQAHAPRPAWNGGEHGHAAMAQAAPQQHGGWNHGGGRPAFAQAAPQPHGGGHGHGGGQPQMAQAVQQHAQNAAFHGPQGAAPANQGGGHPGGGNPGGGQANHGGGGGHGNSGDHGHGKH